MKRITKINDNEYISKEVEHCSFLTGELIQVIIFLLVLGVLANFVNKWI